MWLIMSLATALATPEYPHLTREQVGSAFRLQPGEAQGVEGVVCSWAEHEGDVELAVTNTSGEVLLLDWNQSSYTNANGVAVGVAPGTTKIRDVKAVLPPSVVPPASTVQELVVREDAMVGPMEAQRVPLLTREDVGRDVKMTLAFQRGGQMVWLTQPFHVVRDDYALANMEKWERLSSRRKTGLGWGWVATGVGAIGGLMVLSALPASEDVSSGDRAAIGAVGGVVLLSGGTGTYFLFRQYSRAKRDMQKMERRGQAPPH